MDGANQGSTRKFPGYTTDDLKVACMDYQMGIYPCGEAPAGHVEAMKEEIARRAAGLSKHQSTPQVGWDDVKMKPTTILGRM